MIWRFSGVLGSCTIMPPALWHNFSCKKFVLSMIIRISVTSVPTKPLNDAQMRGAFLYILNSAAFFLVRKFYMLRCLFGALYVDMRCFGVSWVFSKHKIPHPNQWGSMITTKKYCLFNEDFSVVGFICI